MINKFMTDEKGSMLVVIPLALIVIMSIIAFSIDLGNQQGIGVNNQNALDAAALATGEYVLKAKVTKIGQPGYENDQWKSYSPNADDIRKYAFAIYKQNLLADQTLVNTERDILRNTSFTSSYDDTSNSLTVSSCVVHTPQDFASLAGYNREKTLCQSAKAGFSFGDSSLNDTEVAFSIDTGYPMLGNNINYVTAAISNLADVALKGGTNNVYFSIVPYNTNILLTNYESELLDYSPTFNVVRNSTVETTYNFPIPSIDLSRLQNPYPNGYNGNYFEKFKTLKESRNAYSYYYQMKQPTTSGAFSLRTYTPHVTLLPERQRLHFSWSRPELAVQPLTSDKQVIKSMMTALQSATTRVNKDDCFYKLVLGLDMNGMIRGGCYRPGGLETYGTQLIFYHLLGKTYGTSGLFGAWLTVAPGWKGKWAAPSFMETNPPVSVLNPAYVYNTSTGITYRDGSYSTDTTTARPILSPFNVQNRTALPTAGPNALKKIIIHITATNENTLAVPPNDSASSEPVSPVVKQSMFDLVFPETATQQSIYSSLCSKIKDNGIEIYIINMGMAAPDYEASCPTSSQHVFNNVTPAQFENTLRTILNLQAANLKSVRLLPVN